MLILLVMRETWTHQNAIVFDNAPPSVPRLLCKIVDEGRAWSMVRKFKTDMTRLFQALFRWGISEE